ncbi:DUF1643 domain-containing protein [Flavobacterium cerinum]|uniref:DUF1643 domain-containing protein n=1 Tax=Flavobacterium cerinum TaxID=2502784 RepID=A0A3S3QTT6_9FLAO|nr:DUF1643 domain-containing protein [Flavobacterium cerinum]RWX03381.1 DUF1643 domain-containing protein [Flavobacterium cerinum]
MSTSLFTDNNAGAEFSQCGNYRYRLWRVWDESKPKVLFIMLNPSQADDMRNDPTIRRCIGFAKLWGYGGLMVGNIFPYISTEPKALKYVEDFHNDLNLIHISNMANQCSIIVYAYGNAPIEVKHIPLDGWPNRHHLGLTASGNPKHPLYLKRLTVPVPY